jgi:hypothetical protein
MKIAHHTTYKITLVKMAGSRDDNFFFFPFLGFSPSGTQFYEAIVGSSSKPPFLLASKRKKNILTFFGAKKLPSLVHWIFGSASIVPKNFKRAY